MLTAVKNQAKISFLSVKYAVMREMLNKASFISNIVFMVLNNATFIIEWVIFYSLKDNFGGYTFKMVLLLWGIAAGIYGFSHFFFKNAYNLYSTINNGKLDSYLVQPKNVLLSSITTSVEPSAIGDMLYGYIMLFIYGVTLKNFLLFTLFVITGGIIITCISVIFSSLSFWFNKTDMVTDTMNSLMTNFATYPDGIFKGAIKVILYTVVPVGITTYLPVSVLVNFDFNNLLIIVLVCLVLIVLSFVIFNRGLKRYSSSNLMVARM